MGEDLPDLDRPAPYVPPPIPQGVPLPEFGGQTDKQPTQPQRSDADFSPRVVTAIVAIGVVVLLGLLWMVRQKIPRVNGGVSRPH
jgi:hypothetical protein